MSGGVDSSVAAAILKEHGFECFGVTMLIEDASVRVDEGDKRVCYSMGQQRDVDDAATQAAQLGIPHFAIDLRDEFQRDVIEYFKDEYRNGRTPNPCVRCNRDIKFGALIRETRRIAGEFDFLATGHFSRVEYRKDSDRWALIKGADPTKDQSYFLYRLGQDVLSMLKLPLGGMTKPEVRKIAGDMGLKSANRPQSVDFIIPQTFPALFGKPQPGPIKDENGEIRGEHKGLEHFTIGQRRGTGVASKGRMYVVGLDPKTNAVTIGPKDSLMCSGLIASDVNWVSIPPQTEAFDAMVQVRLNQDPKPAVIVPMDDNRVMIEFAKPVFAVAPGQSAVFYKNNMVLGGGVIEEGISIKIQ